MKIGPETSAESGGAAAFGGIADGVYAFWNMREGAGQVLDQRGALPGIGSNLSWGRGGVVFNGTSGSINLKNHALPSQVSVTTWFWTNNSSTTQRMYNNGNSSAGSFAVQIQSGGIRAFAGLGGGGLVIGSTVTIASNTWHIHTATFDGSTLRQFINGVLVSSDAASTTTASGEQFGAIGKNVANNEWFNGAMRLCILHRRALKPVEIQTLHALIASEAWKLPAREVVASLRRPSHNFGLSGGLDGAMAGGLQ